MVSVLPTLYTEKEVAALFGCAPITVKRERAQRLGWNMGWPSWLLNCAGKCRRAAAAEPKQCDLFSANVGEA